MVSPSRFRAPARPHRMFTSRFVVCSDDLPSISNIFVLNSNCNRTSQQGSQSTSELILVVNLEIKDFP